MDPILAADFRPITRSEWSRIVREKFGPTHEVGKKRRNPRVALDPSTLGEAVLTYNDLLQPGHPLIQRTAPVLGVSETGLTLKIYNRVAVSTILQMNVVIDDIYVQISGTVRHCTLGLGAFKLGVEIDFPPEH